MESQKEKLEAAMPGERQEEEIGAVVPGPPGWGPQRAAADQRTNFAKDSGLAQLVEDSLDLPTHTAAPSPRQDHHR